MPITIALAGNPNSGKTTLFNAMTGSNQYVGNWPGVTVEKKEGTLIGNKNVTIVDLPGIYSLSPYSPEEIVSRNFLIDERPDVILNIVDGTNPERNLYLTTQLTELGIPVVVAVNMMDMVDKSGDEIDISRLSKELGCSVVGVSALKGTGIMEAAETAVKAADGERTVPRHNFSGGVEHTLAHIEEAVLHGLPQEQQRFFAIKLFERDVKINEKLALTPEQIAHIEEDIRRREHEQDDDSESIIISERYKYIDSIIKECVAVSVRKRISVTERIDRVVTNRYLALPIFALVMFIVYFVSVTTVGAWVTDWTNEVLFGDIVPGAVSALLISLGSPGWLLSLIVDGAIAGVGAVLGFVPQLLVLFIFLAFLESCGYMARIAFILDRIFRKFGLSGKSFIPILIGTGCGVPGIMASRTIENERDRRMTVITTTFIPCAAKLPVIALIAGAMFKGAWWVAPGAYFIGIAAIICSGVILKKTKMFQGTEMPFIMELPPYHMPTAGGVFGSMWERGWSFIKKAGTVILAGSIVIWFASNYGWTSGSFGPADAHESILAAFGKGFAWIFAPLGWGNWQAAVAALAGLVAKESIVGTFGILYGFTQEQGSGAQVWSALAADFTTLSAYSFLVFNLLCAPCVAAMGAIRREMNSAKWFWFAIGYQCVFAYIVSLCIYQLGMLFGGVFGPGTAAAIILTALFLYMLFRKSKGVSSYAVYEKEMQPVICEMSGSSVKPGSCRDCKRARRCGKK